MSDSDTPEPAPASGPAGRAGQTAKPAEGEAGAKTGQGASAALTGDSLPELEDAPSGEGEAAPRRGKGPASIEAMLNVDLDVRVVLGDCKMPISTLLKLNRGSVVELDQRIGDPVRIVVNDKTVARGELVKLAGERIGVSLTEIVREHIGEG